MADNLKGEDLNEISISSVEVSDQSWYVRRGKRIFDFLVALVGLILLAIPLLLIAFLSRLAHGAPVIFSQKRIGRNGMWFTLYKFRTMSTRSQDDNPVTVAGDIRITPWGRFLRILKSDEFPQLLCVLRGDMSFVGPRPDVSGYWNCVTGNDRKLLELRPGITGPVTLVFRDEEQLLARHQDPKIFNDTILFPEKVRLNHRYAKELSFFSDFKWIMYTFLPEPWLRARLRAEGWTRPDPST